jgi:threonine/homoserine/homoserine lactone efflux protein
MSLELYLAFVVACVVLAMVPGPTVTVLIANGLKHGTRAALITLLGTQVGLAVVIAIVGAGLTTLMATMGYWFDWLRLAGAAYLIWIGIGMLRAKGGLAVEGATAPPRGGFFLQGLLVLLSNPKVLVFFGAFIPQFVDMKGDHFSQVALLGATFMVVAGATDAIYAVLAGRARAVISQHRERLISRFSGLFMIGGGLWLAFTRAR